MRGQVPVPVPGVDSGHLQVPSPDWEATPDGFVVIVPPNERIHFLDWGGPTEKTPGGRTVDAPVGGVLGTPGVLLVHGLSATAWIWAPIARRLRQVRRTVAIDLRGHGLSDAPTQGYRPADLAGDVVAVADGARLLGDAAAAGASAAAGAAGVVLAGHGFGGIVAAWAAVELGASCAGLVLVDGGWEDIRASTGMEPDEFLRGLDEPPEVLRSMNAYLADRRGFDPATWDDDQEKAAREAVTQLPAGHVVSATRPHALAASVGAMFEYRPLDVLPALAAPITALVAGDDGEAGSRAAALADVQAALTSAGRAPIRVERYPGVGHNLMRYRPAEVTAALLTATLPTADRGYHPRS
jgi:pimeloyl-ACP methyl ester carboxylesterase